MDGTVETQSYTVLEDGEFRRRSVRRVASGARVILLDPATANYVALIENGELDDWEVEAAETVTVPAGTFKAFRPRSSPGLNRDRVRRIWYAPEIALIVREEYEYLGQVSPDRRPRLIRIA